MSGGNTAAGISSVVDWDALVDISEALSRLRLLYGAPYLFGHDPDRNPAEPWWVSEDGKVGPLFTAPTPLALGGLLDNAGECGVMIRQRVNLLAGFHATGPAPFVDTGTWSDDVARMHALLERLQGRVPDLAWTPPAGTTGHVLTWTEDGEPRDHPSRLLGELCEWADAKWPVQR